MPPRKRPSAARDESEDSEQDVKPNVKRQSTSAAKADNTAEGSGSSEAMQQNDQGEDFFKLSESRRVTIRTFNKKTLIDMREYYKDKTTGEQKPGSKGISLTKEQWTMLKENMSVIDEAVAKLESK